MVKKINYIMTIEAVIMTTKLMVIRTAREHEGTERDTEGVGCDMS